MQLKRLINCNLVQLPVLCSCYIARQADEVNVLETTIATENCVEVSLDPLLLGRAVVINLAVLTDDAYVPVLTRTPAAEDNIAGLRCGDALPTSFQNLLFEKNAASRADTINPSSLHDRAHRGGAA